MIGPDFPTSLKEGYGTLSASASSALTCIVAALLEDLRLSLSGMRAESPVVP